MSEIRDELVVHQDAIDLGGDSIAGRLRRVRRGGNSVVSFAFEAVWLKRKQRLLIDPSLALYEGDQYTSHAGLPGIFTDAAPDRWGRTLLQRREAATARREQRRARTLDDWDFLVGVSDELRMGALRLADPASGLFVNSDHVSVPPMARLRQLASYARRAERGEQLSLKEEDEELALLIAPGSSLGGTRPKANFLAPDGSLWIAKFPSRNDAWDVGAWELVLTQLARRAGIPVPESRLLKLAGDYHTFTAKRFDRVMEGRRMYASALTLTGKGDHDPAGYVDIVQAITQYGDPRTIGVDLAQLYRRAAFNVMVANRDDHLRNHGFIGLPAGWRLSPAFDLNPSPGKVDHAIALGDGDSSPSIDLVLRSAAYYRLSQSRAADIVKEVRDQLAGWRGVAASAGLKRDEIETMESAFVI